MADWVGIILFLAFLGIFISQIVSGEAKTRKLRQVWASFAGQQGLQFTEGQNKVKCIIKGTYLGHEIQVSAYLNAGTRNGPVEYTEATLTVRHLDDVILASGLSLSLWNFNQRKPASKLSRLTSGDGIFDASYSIKDTPPEKVQNLLHSYEVRSAIKTIYPLSAAIFEHPTLDLHESYLRVRIYRSCESESTIQRFIEDACHLAAMLEKAAATSALADHTITQNQTD